MAKQAVTITRADRVKSWLRELPRFPVPRIPSHLLSRVPLPPEALLPSISAFKEREAHFQGVREAAETLLKHTRSRTLSITEYNDLLTRSPKLDAREQGQFFVWNEIVGREVFNEAARKGGVCKVGAGKKDKLDSFRADATREIRAAKKMRLGLVRIAREKMTQVEARLAKDKQSLSRGYDLYEGAERSVAARRALLEQKLRDK